MINVTQVRYAGGHSLALLFSDGTLGVADLTKELKRKAFAPLRDEEAFAKAFVEDGTVCWPAGLDLAAERLYALAHNLTPPETLEQVRANERAVSLRELRLLIGKSQQELAAALELTQSQISRLEQREDHLLSTIRNTMRALGGDVEVVAVLNGKRLKLAV